MYLIMIYSSNSLIFSIIPPHHLVHSVPHRFVNVQKFPHFRRGQETNKGTEQGAVEWEGGGGGGL